jgi:hypothetical protein
MLHIDHIKSADVDLLMLHCGYLWSLYRFVHIKVFSFHDA